MFIPEFYQHIKEIIHMEYRQYKRRGKGEKGNKRIHRFEKYLESPKFNL